MSDWEFKHDSEKEQRDAEKADMIVGWAAVILVICWIAAIVWGWV